MHSMSRPTIDRWFMSMAEVAAQRSTCLRAQVGCAIAIGNRLLVVGYGGSPKGLPHCLEVGCEIGDTGGCVRTKDHHAEQNALAWARSTGIDVTGATCFTTLSPCTVCAITLHVCGIRRVVYRDAYRKPEAIDWLRERGVTVEQIVLAP
jgi:dCMP deaminase